MRFSLKFCLLAFIALATGIGWYVTHREAELGVRVRVPQPLGLDDYYEVPESLLEIRSRRQVREHDWRYENAEAIWKDQEVERIRHHVTGFYPSIERHRKLLLERRTEMLSIARANLVDSAGFRAAVTAAWILDHCDQPKGFHYIKNRFLAQRPGDAKDLDALLYGFDDERLASDPEKSSGCNRQRS